MLGIRCRASSIAGALRLPRQLVDLHVRVARASRKRHVPRLGYCRLIAGHSAGRAMMNIPYVGSLSAIAAATALAVSTSSVLAQQQYPAVLAGRASLPAMSMVDAPADAPENLKT